MNNKRKNNSLLSYFNKSTKSVVNSDRDEPQPAPSQPKDTETVDLMTCSIARKDDIGLFVNYDLSDTDKNLILTNVWVPSETYIFPIIEENKGRNLKFQHHWLKMFKCGIGCQKLHTLVIKPMDSFKKVLETLNNHAKHEYHKLALEKADYFLNTASSKEPEIINKLNIDRAKKINENRGNLIHIIDCILVCGRQEIALRGHRDFGAISFDDEPEMNEGNFRAILKFKAKDIDHLKNFLSSNYRNKYISPSIQNDIISTCGDVILKKVVKEVNESGYFSVLADETTDISVVEQLTICVRYLVGSGKEKNVHESFLKFTEVASLIGENLASAIFNGYDGASNMSGHIKGVRTIIRNKYPKALYVHCVAHTLNLAVSSACNIQPVRNCLGTIEKMYCFFNSPKRHQVILKAISESDLDPKVKTLKRLCATRWIQRYDAINDFVELFPYVVVSLEKISEWNDLSSVDANILLKSMDSKFLISLQVIKVLFSYGLPLCKQLQQIKIDLREAVELASDNVKVLKNLRENIEVEFRKMFENAKYGDFLDITISVDRLNKRQKHRDNPLTNENGSLDPEVYYRVTICIPFIDSFITQLSDRFLDHRNVFCGFQCLFDYESGDVPDEFDELIKFYLPECDINTVRAELKMWKIKLERTENKPKSGLDAIKECNNIIYPNIFNLLNILCTLPVSTATPERIFSCLKRLKTYTRNTMKEERLNGLTLMAVYRNISITAEEVLDELAKKKRKLDLLI
ncbi:hypothetical protein QTP88_010459 [Uroleucon formosanum]